LDQLKHVTTKVNRPADRRRACFRSRPRLRTLWIHCDRDFRGYVASAWRMRVGLVGALIRKVVKITPPMALTFVVVFLGVLSIASDAAIWC
jgi:hypothetical protein